MSLLQWKNSNVVMCKFFPASLEGEARNWFYTLPVGSIGNYGVLVETFLETYMHNSIARPRVNKLFILARRFREPLRSLTDRWRKLYTDIGKVPVDQQIFGFENSLGKLDPIWIVMFTEKPQTLKEMRRMQEHYKALEEIQERAHHRGVQEASKAAEAVPQEVSKRPEKRSGPHYKPSGKKEWVEKGKKPRHNPRTYTSLNAPLEEIFKEVEKRNDIRYPKIRRVQFDETKNHPEFYHYHHFWGHSTNDCESSEKKLKKVTKVKFTSVEGPKTKWNSFKPRRPYYHIDEDENTKPTMKEWIPYDVV
ncbi:uncharacterized protein LOC113352418 [Papaver somniferum]|uniref:uncharacterized protein LOC113352418 n=1 Tax=Papaver somniferum TaxID=3469 RepID=UPI000E6FB5E2|nr:uncharacterized protein LOC113352418 [Papaver somniferum]